MLFSTVLLVILGEHIKTWRPRYFVLKKDGFFYGYNSRPMPPNEIESPNDQFFVKGKSRGVC